MRRARGLRNRIANFLTALSCAIAGHEYWQAFSGRFCSVCGGREPGGLRP